jgi:hypothetical protein
MGVLYNFYYDDDLHTLCVSYQLFISEFYFILFYSNCYLL